MVYTVIDEKGIKFSDIDGNTQTLSKGNVLPQKLIDENVFRLEGIQSLIKDGRLKDDKKPESKPAIDSKTDKPVKTKIDKPAKVKKTKGEK